LAHLRSAKLPAFLLAVLYAVAGIAIAPYPGIQNDEAMFASPLYPPHVSAFGIAGVPIMEMDYVGSFKAWIYAVIFAAFPPSHWSLRLPVIFVGAASVCLFTLLLGRMNTRAAWIGGSLLASDPAFALTNNFDWGPVALQHFFLIAGLLCAMQFQQTSRTRWLALTSLAFGLGLWDKAIFLWMLIPVCAATLLLWPRIIREGATMHNVLTALGGFALGAAPLLWFNATHHWITFRSHTVFSAAELPMKLAQFHYTANGSALFGYLVLGPRRSSLLEWGFVLALLLLPFVWKTDARKPALFSLLVLIGGWAMMTFNRDTGGAAHHIILLWPMPQLFIAVVLTRMSLADVVLAHGRHRYAGTMIVGVLVLSNALVYQRYWRNLRSKGPALVWTDAIDSLSTDPSLAAADPLYILDWGIIDPLQVLHRGTLPLRSVPTNLQQIEGDLRNPKALWVSHVDGAEQFTGINARLATLAQSCGLHKVSERVYNDRHGRPVFQTFRFVSAI